MTLPQSSAAPAPWLEVIDGRAPLLLIAPHGGRAGAAARATLHPKVNDLETAGITRELARRLDASALINVAMDRNEIDCNRLEQVAERAPWLLALVAARVEAIVARHGRAIVLLMHGWNIIEPRVDFGLGLREVDGALRPPAGAHVSASDAFISGPVATLAERLQRRGIIPSYGLRYPGGARQNLLQAFTARHAASQLAPVGRLAALAAAGLIDALQLEMSVTVRLAGAGREHNLDALTEVFAPLNGHHLRPPSARTSITILRTSTPPPVRAAVKPAGPMPARVGIEFYDSAECIGGLASFDFGPGAAGARIMILLAGGRVALFTAEGRARRGAGRIELGPLRFTATADRGALRFSGPAVVVNDGAAYLSVEQALAAGSVDSAMEIDATLEVAHHLRGPIDFRVICDAQPDTRAEPGDSQSVAEPPTAAFGWLRGTVAVDHRRRPLNAIARIGASFTGLGTQQFTARRMAWAAFPDATRESVIEARELTMDNAKAGRGRLLTDGTWRDAGHTALSIDSPAADVAPARIIGTIGRADGPSLRLTGRPATTIMLSRPGLGAVRIHTALGFANYRVGSREGVGLFEYSRTVTPPSRAGDDQSEPDAD